MKELLAPHFLHASRDGKAEACKSQSRGPGGAGQLLCPWLGQMFQASWSQGFRCCFVPAPEFPPVGVIGSRLLSRESPVIHRPRGQARPHQLSAGRSSPSAGFGLDTSTKPQEAPCVPHPVPHTYIQNLTQPSCQHCEAVAYPSPIRQSDTQESDWSCSDSLHQGSVRLLKLPEW